MGKVKTERIALDGATEKELDFQFDVHVSMEGLFTATLPLTIAELFVQAGIELCTNGRAGSRKGFFSDRTYEGLIRQINAVAKEYLSCKLIQKSIVLRYVIQTTCAYLLNDAGEIVPNGNCVENYGGQHHWRGGTLYQHATDPKPYGLQTYVKAFWREEYQYKSGKTQTRYVAMSENDCNDNQPNLKWICGICSIKSPSFSEVMEIDYDEDTAEFFVNIIRSICALNEKIKSFIDPQSIKQLVANKMKLLA